MDELAPESAAESNIYASVGQRIDTGLLAVAICLITAFVFFSITPSMADADLWWHLRNAQLQLTSHAFLTHDVYSFTASGSAWMNHEWLAELPFYAGFHVLGYKGVYFVTFFTIEAIFLGLFTLTWLETGTLPASLLATLIAIILSTVSFGPRTLLYGWLFLVAELLIFSLSRRNKKAIWALPPLFLFWVNAHGSWLIGMVIFALFIGSNAITLSKGAIDNTAVPSAHTKQLILAWLASFVALFANPYGWRLVYYPFDLAFRQKLNIANIEEWKTLDFHTPRGRLIFLCLGLTFVFQLLRNRRWTLFELATAALGLYSAFTYSRFLFLAAILICPALARSFATRKTPRPFSALVATACVVLILSIMVGRVRTLDLSSAEKDPKFPTRALPYLATFHPDGKVFNEFTWGGFLEWYKRDTPVFIDSRVDIFEYNGTFKDYLDITKLHGDPVALLASHDIKYVLYGRDTPLVYLLKTSQQWRVLYEDPTTTLLIHKRPQDLPTTN